MKLDVQVITVWSHWLGSKVKTGVFEAGSVRGTGGADYPAARGQLFWLDRSGAQELMEQEHASICYVMRA